jgi:CDP-paratose 2-epimerase
MKVLVTGGCGFIGSHTCEFFKRMDWDVVSYDNMTKHELNRTGYQTEAARDYNWNILGDLGIKRVCGDVRNLEQLLDNASGCDYIVHTAAQPAVTISMEDPILDASTNVIGTLNVLETAKRHSLPVVSCATIHVYGNWINDTLQESTTRFTRDPEAVDETAMTMQGYLTPLHASKASAEYYVKVYADTYHVRAGSFRLTGLYGPRQFGGEDHGWVANFAIRNILGWPLVVYGSGKQVRDILFATDVAEAFWAFYQSGEAGVYNIGGGPEHAISLLECITLIEEATGTKAEVKFEPERFGDLKYFVCDSSKALNSMGWKAQVKPQEGVPRLIEWVQQSRDIFHA